MKITYKNAQKYFKMLERVENKFWDDVDKIEKLMQKETKIKDIEFQRGGDWIYGIGSADRTMKLIHRS